MGQALGSVAFRAFSHLVIPEPMVLSGQEEERHTYIKEVQSPSVYVETDLEVSFARWRVNLKSLVLVFISIPVAHLGFESFQDISFPWNISFLC